MLLRRQSRTSALHPYLGSSDKASQGNMDRAFEVLEMMTDDKFRYPFDNFICTSVISGFCRIGKPHLAIRFYNNAKRTRCFRSSILTYTALLSAYCNMGRTEEVSNLVCRIEEEGLSFDVVFYSSWMHECFKEGVHWKALTKIREMMVRKIKMDMICYTILIDGFSKNGNVEKAVGFLHKMNKERLKPNLVTYSAIILGFCKKGKLEEAFSVLKIVEDYGFKVDEFVYATLIDGVCGKGDFDCASCLLGYMEKKGVKPSTVTYNCVINGLCKAYRTQEADEFSKSFNCDVFTYGTLIDGYVKEENENGVLETKRRFELSGLCMDVVMCNILIEALFMIGLFDDALAIYREMPKIDLVANAVTYCTMIDGCCKFDRINEALEIFDEFRANSVSSVASYNRIIYGLCSKGMSDLAIEVILELYDRGLVSDKGINMILLKAIVAEKGDRGVRAFIHRVEGLRSEISYMICNDAIYLMCRRGFLDVAIDVYLLMKNKGLSIYDKSYYVIIKALMRDGKEWLTHPLLNTLVKMYGISEPRVGKILLHHLCKKDLKNALKFVDLIIMETPNFIFPSHVLKMLMTDNRVLDAYKLVIRAESNLPIMDVIDYTMLIDELCKERYVGEALNLCAQAKRKGIVLNIFTYNSVINGLCQQGCLIHAFRLFDTVEKINLVPSEVTYATLINILSNEGYLLDARKLFDSMVLKGLHPNTRIYNSLVGGYCKLGKSEEASKFLVDMEIRGLVPDEFTVSFTINGLCQKGDMEGALSSFLEFQKKGLLPDFLGFLYLIRGLYAKGRMEECRSILREMLDNDSVGNLLEKAETEVKTESIASFLVFLCDQGSIKEVIMVLDEVASMFFPVTRKSTAYIGKGKLEGHCDGYSQGTVESRFTFKSANQEEFGKLEKEQGSQVTSFGSIYSRIASLCSRGELGKANKLAKMLCGS